MLIITGTYPPRKCGVGDYCQKLLSTSIAKNWELYTHDNWSVFSLYNKIKDIKKTNFVVANIQYPTVGYSTSLLPHLIAIYIKIIMKRKLIVTFHEYSQLGWKGQLAAKIFFKCADKIIFTTEFERQYAITNNKYLENKSSIIKIFSNIDVEENQPMFHDREYDMGYFGYIRPDKGIEEFVSTSKSLLRNHPNMKIYIMGQTQKEYEFFHAPLLQSLEGSKIQLILNQDMKAVASVLSKTKIAYLPYPDGLTERRGSFLAALLHHCIIVTTKGKFTTKAQLNSFNFVNNNDAYLEIINILNLSKHEIEEKINIADKYIENQVPKSWEQVASQYNLVIKSL